MSRWTANAPQIYACVYFGAIILLTLAEWAAPRRKASDLLSLRWFTNFSLTILDSLVAKALFPVAALGWAALCAQRGWGILAHASLPAWVTLGVTALVLDFVLYAQHVVLHRVPALWQVHRTHHADQEYDFTTGLRFHPLEHLFSTAVLFAGIAVLGSPPWAVLVSQLITVVQSFAEHANVRIPARVDRVVRLVFVTPDMHRVHHSVDVREGESNFANTFTWWDRLFGTYIAQPRAGHDAMAFGVAGFTERKHLMLHWSLVNPFLRAARPGGVSSPASVAARPPADAGLRNALRHR